MSSRESGFFRRLISGIFGRTEPSEEPESVELVFEESLFTSDRAEYLEFLDTYVECISDELVPPPESLQEKLAEYLRQLTQEIVAPSRELVDEFFDYVGSRIEPRADFPPYEQVVTQLREEFFPVLTSADFEPLDSAGVEQFIVLFNMGAMYSLGKVITGLLNMLKTLHDKAKQFQVPSGFDLTQHVFQKVGPFQLWALGRINFFSSILFKNVIASRKNKKLYLIEFKQIDTVPYRYIIAITAELRGFSVLLTDKPVQKGGWALAGTNFKWVPTVGPISVDINVEYNMLKSRSVNLEAIVSPYFGLGAKDNDYLTTRLEVELKYYTLDFRT